ncbi:MAG: histone deacetylase, partial [Solirubrobacteraceae bacterium]
DDPLADCSVSDFGFALMAELVRDLGAELEAPVGCVLEGGYDVDALGRCVVLTMETFAAELGTGEGRELQRIPVHPLVNEAFARLMTLWPDVSSGR